MNYNIRQGSIEEIEGFQLFDEENQGEAIIVAEAENGKVAGYAQYTGESLYFLESECKGAGRALVKCLQEKNDYLVARNVEPTAKGFWEKMGFQFAGNDGYGGEDWDWE